MHCRPGHRRQRAHQISEPTDEYGFFVTDFDSPVPAHPELLFQFDDFARFASEVAIHETREACELIDIGGTEQNMEMVRETTEA